MEERFRNCVESEEFLWGSNFLGWPITASMLNDSKLADGNADSGSKRWKWWKRRFWVIGEQ